MGNFRLIAILMLALSISLSINAQDIKELDKTFKLAKTGSVEVETFKGSIKVETWDKAEVQVHVKIEPDGWDRDQEEKVKDTEIIFRDSENRVSMKTEYNESRHTSFFGNSGSNPFVHYTIKMPKTAELDINDYKSDIDISNLSADIALETYKGTVVIKGLEGSIDLETYKGEADVDFIKLTKDSRFESYKGRIDVSLPASTKFSVDADLGKKGDFDSEFELSTSERRRKHDDDYVRGDINGGGPYIEFSTYKGDLRLLKK